MGDSKLFNSEVFIILKKALDTASLRQRAIAQNIANVDTPGYKRADVTFEDELKAALNRMEKLELTTTHPRHISNRPDLEKVAPQVIRQQDTLMRNDQSNVDIEIEMANLAKNNIAYNTLSELIARKLRGLRETIEEIR